MHIDSIKEARRQAEICNACRYCEGFCSVFPAMHRERTFSDADLTQLANLCHNCRGCYYACQYTSPHEFDLNLPRALAELRHDSWQNFAWPQGFARAFHERGAWTVLAVFLGVAFVLAAIGLLGGSGEGFYAVFSHNAMLSIFVPAFLFPLVSLTVSLRRYWRATGGGPVGIAEARYALGMVAAMKDLAAGHGEGCNFEDRDRFSHARRYAHQLVLFGFLLCFAATAVGTLMHYLFAMPAPYLFWSPPKLLGVPGGLMLTAGSAWMVVLKRRADPALGDPRAWSGDMAFIALLGLVALSGLLLYGLGATPAMPALLALHLGVVASFFVLAPFTKMAHGFYRTAALLRDYAGAFRR
ncbi:MAG: tricarballylate utilization 4Fe-4S protein TcuB [Maritimibacter sp.]|nr:tricarballylate utilization 4Fe-4S protein TcuB [Maritimibacter sp.]